MIFYFSWGVLEIYKNLLLEYSINETYFGLEFYHGLCWIQVSPEVFRKMQGLVGFEFCMSFHELFLFIVLSIKSLKNIFLLRNVKTPAGTGPWYRLEFLLQINFGLHPVLEYYVKPSKIIEANVTIESY